MASSSQNSKAGSTQTSHEDIAAETKDLTTQTSESSEKGKEKETPSGSSVKLTKPAKKGKAVKKKVVLLPEVQEQEEEVPPVCVCPKFYYFTYGINMLACKLHEHFPTAKRVGRGRLDDYRLDFYTYCEKWGGAPATMVMSQGSCVLGAIWEMNVYDREGLDTHEGVHAGTYVAKLAPIFSIDTREILICRTYHLTRYPQCDLRCAATTCVPRDRRPSRTYLKTIIKGAMETGLDEAIIEWLRRYYHNGVELLEIELELDLDDLELITVYR